MRNSTILIFSSIILIGCDMLGIGKSDFRGLSISTDKQQYALGETRVVTFNNTSKQIVYLENCSWVLEKQIDIKWEVVDGAVCTPIIASVDIPIQPNEIYRDTLRFSISSGLGEYRYVYSVLNSNKEKIPSKSTQTNTFQIVE